MHDINLIFTKHNSSGRCIRLLKEQLLNDLNDDRLNQIHKMEVEIIEKREDKMLSIIYQFSKLHQYRTGLFFIRSGHRESMLKKIGKSRIISELTLNWVLAHDRLSTL